MKCHRFLVLFVFFSSRRRHTRCYRDWSSDVCSSDLHGAEHQAQALLLPADLGIVPADGQAQVHGARDGARVAALALAPTVERGVALREDLWGEEGHVPAVGMARHQPEETLLPLPADPEAEPRLHRPRLAERALEAELPALERDALAVEERAQGLRRLL